jgi:hypothetical protein
VVLLQVRMDSDMLAWTTHGNRFNTNILVITSLIRIFVVIVVIVIIVIIRDILRIIIIILII